MMLFIEPHWLTEEEEKRLGEPQSEKQIGDCTAKFNGFWYFYDEKRSRLFGPFRMKEEASVAAGDYAACVLEGSDTTTTTTTTHTTTTTTTHTTTSHTTTSTTTTIIIDRIIDLIKRKYFIAKKMYKEKR